MLKERFLPPLKGNAEIERPNMNATSSSGAATGRLSRTLQGGLSTFLSGNGEDLRSSLGPVCNKSEICTPLIVCLVCIFLDRWFRAQARNRVGVKDHFSSQMVRLAIQSLAL